MVSIFQDIYRTLQEELRLRTFNEIKTSPIAKDGRHVRTIFEWRPSLIAFADISKDGSNLHEVWNGESSATRIYYNYGDPTVAIKFDSQDPSWQLVSFAPQAGFYKKYSIVSSALEQRHSVTAGFASTIEEALDIRRVAGQKEIDIAPPVTLPYSFNPRYFRTLPDEIEDIVRLESLPKQDISLAATKAAEILKELTLTKKLAQRENARQDSFVTHLNSLGKRISSREISGANCAIRQYFPRYIMDPK